MSVVRMTVLEAVNGASPLLARSPSPGANEGPPRPTTTSPRPATRPGCRRAKPWKRAPATAHGGRGAKGRILHESFLSQSLAISFTTPGNHSSSKEWHFYSIHKCNCAFYEACKCRVVTAQGGGRAAGRVSFHNTFPTHRHCRPVTFPLEPTAAKKTPAFRFLLLPGKR